MSPDMRIDHIAIWTENLEVLKEFYENYFEAKSASSIKDFINFFTHSLKSANESKFWLTILMDANKCDKTEANYLLKETSEIANVLASSIITMKRKK